MTTVNKAVADRVKAANGLYKDDPQVFKIVEYDNAWGGQGYGLEYEHNQGKYKESNCVMNPRTYWSYNGNA